MSVTVSNGYASNNADIAVKVTSTVSGNVQHVNVDNTAGLSLAAYDYLSVTYPIATQEVFVYKTGGSGGTTVSTVTVNYTDATKANISNVTKV